LKTIEEKSRIQIRILHQWYGSADPNQNVSGTLLHSRHNPEADLWEDVLELEVDPADGEDGAVNQTGIPRQARQYGFHVVPAVKRDSQRRIGIILAPFYENYFQFQENCRQ
jgi:hypothetical protein